MQGRCLRRPAHLLASSLPRRRLGGGSGVNVGGGGGSGAGAAGSTLVSEVCGGATCVDRAGDLRLINEATAAEDEDWQEHDGEHSRSRSLLERRRLRRRCGGDGARQLGRLCVAAQWRLPPRSVPPSRSGEADGCGGAGRTCGFGRAASGAVPGSFGDAAFLAGGSEAASSSGSASPNASQPASILLEDSGRSRLASGGGDGSFARAGREAEDLASTGRVPGRGGAAPGTAGFGRGAAVISLRHESSAECRVSVPNSTSRR